MHIGFGQWAWSQMVGEPGLWMPPAGLSGGLDLRPSALQGTPGKQHGDVSGMCLVVSPTALDSSFIILSNDDHPVEAKTDAKMLAACESALGWRPAGDTVAQLIYNLLTAGSHPDGDLGVRPLLPGMDRQLRVYLPGIGQIWGETFRYGKHPHTNKVRDVERLTYREIYTKNPKGRLPGKFLGLLGQKYQLTDPEDSFIPADLPKIKKEKPETSYSDNFDRTNAADLGASWTAIADTPKIASNKATTTNNSVNTMGRYDSDLSGTDHYAQVTGAATNSSAGRSGVITRKDGTATVTCYCHFGNWATDIAAVSKFVAGTETSLGTHAHTLANTDTPVIKGQSNGSTITTDFDAVNEVSLTDTAITTGVRGGIHLQSTAMSNATANDWSEADLSVANPVRYQTTMGCG